LIFNTRHEFNLTPLIKWLAEPVPPQCWWID
jgi:hypothetical protein